MNPKKLKRNVIVTTVLFLAILANLLRMQTLNTIRAVDALHLIGCGMILGVLLVNVFLFMKNKP